MDDRNAFWFLLCLAGAVAVVAIVWTSAARSELIDPRPCANIQLALDTLQGRTLTPQEVAVKEKLEEWFIRYGCHSKYKPAHFNHVDSQWAQSLRSKSGVNCCTTADGATVKDPDWGIEKSEYWVWLEGERVPVHPNAVIEAPNRTNTALVWTVRINGKLTIKCFLPGHLT